MRRAVARGRVFPQYFSTDRRYGRLSLKACALFPLMWANADDQGRLPGDPEEIKYAACPNIDHITKADTPALLEELEKNELIKIYSTPKTKAIQFLDWWEVQRLQWAWPSQYPAMEGWEDHLRYKKDAKTVVTLNWPISGDNSGEYSLGAQVSGASPSGDESQTSPLSTSSLKEHERERGIRRGRGRSPEASGEDPSPSATSLLIDEIEILHTLTEYFKRGWGKVPASSPHEIIPREPKSRESAQLRDLAGELSAAGGCTSRMIMEAFQDAAGRPGKMHVSYVRGIILDWIGVKR